MTTQWILELIDKITDPLRKVTQAADSATSVIDNVEELVDDLGKTSDIASGKLEKLGKGMFFLNQLKEGVDNIKGAFNDAIEPGVRFEYALAQVQAVSGLSNDKMELISDKARDLAVAFGVDAAEGTGVFTNILSQLGPELAEYPDVLDAMGRNAMTLSKTMGGDVNGAVSALTASFNAFKPPVADATESAKIMDEQMNIIAKSAQLGAAEVTDIVQSLKNVGPAAKNAGVSFSETNAVLQVLGQNQVKAAEAGTALRNMMLILAAPSPTATKFLKQAGVDIEKMTNKSIPLAERLQSLVPIMDDATVMSNLFGRENNVAAQILIGNTDKIREWTDEVQGSTSAVDQAAIMMNTYAERQKRMQAFIDDLKISFFEFIEPIAPVIEIVGVLVGALVTAGTVAWSMGQIMPLVSVKSAVVWIAGMAKMALATITSSALMSKAIFGIPIIGWIALVITAITALVAYLWNKFASVRAFFYGLWNFIKVIFTEYYKFIFNVMKAIWNVINPANWFDDDFHFSDVWDRLADQAVEGGKKVGSAFSDGWKEGMADWDKSHQARKKEEGQFKLGDSPLTPVNQQNTVSISGGSSSSGNGKSTGLGGTDGGNVRNVTMNVTMNNNFSVSGMNDVRNIVNQVKRELIALMTDAVPAMG